MQVHCHEDDYTIRAPTTLRMARRLMELVALPRAPLPAVADSAFPATAAGEVVAAFAAAAGEEAAAAAGAVPLAVASAFAR